MRKFGKDRMTIRQQSKNRRFYPGTFLHQGGWLLSLGMCAALITGFAISCAGPKVRTQAELLQLQACIDNIEKGDYNAAESRCEICLEYNHRAEECLNGLGLVWYARGVDDKARDYFKRAIRENGDFAQARNNLGVLEFNQTEFQKAALHFEASIEIDPRYLDGRYNLALSLLRLGERRRAEAYIDEAAGVESAGKAVDPAKIWLNIDSRDRDYIMDHYNRAEDHYRKIFELYPQHVDSYHDMGAIMTFRAEIEKVENRRTEWISDAETYFVRCLDLAPEHERCHANLAHLFLAVGRFDESLFHYVQCLAANKNNPICNSELKLAYSGSQLKGEALQSYMDQLAQNPGYAPGHYGFCIALFDKGLTEMAVVECENALKLDETLCLAHYQLGLHFKSVLDRDQALFHCRGLLSCAGDDRYPVEVQECKEIVQALEAT